MRKSSSNTFVSPEVLNTSSSESGRTSGAIDNAKHYNGTKHFRV